MSSSFLDDNHDLEPPPSAQPIASGIVGVRSRGTAARRPAAHRHRLVSISAATPLALSGRPAANKTQVGDQAPGLVASHGMTSSSCAKPSNAAQSHHISSSLSSSSSALPSRSSTTSAAPTSAARSPFDPWNSSSTGHQRAENRLAGSTWWRESRNSKLGEQYRGGLSGGARVADTVGAGSRDFGKDGRKENGGWERGVKGLRTADQRGLAEGWGASKASKSTVPGQKGTKFAESDAVGNQLRAAGEGSGEATEGAVTRSGDIPEPFSKPSPKQIFEGLCFHLNGSTAPLVSDLKLKQLLASRGGQTSIVLGRRHVTHVIVGAAQGQGGVGGVLSASKMQKEIARTGGKGVKFVGAEWVLESIRADRRLPEARFPSLKLATTGQNSVYAMMRTAAATRTASPNAVDGEHEGFAGG